MRNVTEVETDDDQAADTKKPAETEARTAAAVIEVDQSHAIKSAQEVDPGKKRRLEGAALETEKVDLVVETGNEVDLVVGTGSAVDLVVRTGNEVDLGVEIENADEGQGQPVHPMMKCVGVGRERNTFVVVVARVIVVLGEAADIAEKAVKRNEMETDTLKNLNETSGQISAAVDLVALTILRLNRPPNISLQIIVNLDPPLANRTPPLALRTVVVAAKVK